MFYTARNCSRRILKAQFVFGKWPIFLLVLAESENLKAINQAAGKFKLCSVHKLSSSLYFKESLSLRLAFLHFPREQKSSDKREKLFSRAFRRRNKKKRRADRSKCRQTMESDTLNCSLNSHSDITSQRSSRDISIGSEHNNMRWWMKIFRFPTRCLLLSHRWDGMNNILIFRSKFLTNNNTVEGDCMHESFILLTLCAHSTIHPSIHPQLVGNKKSCILGNGCFKINAK